MTKTILNYKKPLKIAAAVICVCLLFNIGYYSIKFGQEMYYQAKILPKVESVLGISTGTPYINGVEVIELRVIPNSIGSDSGVMNGDVLTSHTLGKFAKSIYDSRGKPFQFKVKRNGNDVLITLLVIPNFNY